MPDFDLKVEEQLIRTQEQLSQTRISYSWSATTAVYEGDERSERSEDKILEEKNGTQQKKKNGTQQKTKRDTAEKKDGTRQKTKRDTTEEKGGTQLFVIILFGGIVRNAYLCKKKAGG